MLLCGRSYIRRAFREAEPRKTLPPPPQCLVAATGAAVPNEAEWSLAPFGIPWPMAHQLRSRALAHSV
jgi:hypothetical protein